MIDPAAIMARLERLEAERASLLVTLKSVLALHRGNEFLFSEQQAVLRGAKALVVECEEVKR